MQEGNYGVFFGNEQVGKVNVRRQGLYLQFQCRCRVTGKTVYRLRVRCGEKQESIGVLVPVNDGFGLNTKLPAKRFGNGNVEFLLVPKYEKENGIFVPIYPEEPFAYISRLKEAYLVRKAGQTGLLIK